SFILWEYTKFIPNSSLSLLNNMRLKDSQILKLNTRMIGALRFWPLTIYFSVEMYIKQMKI
ncbi:hypothetical protein HN51_045789, partial [Arachis hypogaea]